MEINKQLFEDVLSGKLKGTFVLRNWDTYFSAGLNRNYNKYRFTHPYIIGFGSYTPKGIFCTDSMSKLDIIDFIPETNMETKELKIEIPEGFEIDKENSSFEKIVFKKKEKAKPRSWDEYCSNFKGKFYYIQDDRSNIATSFTSKGFISAYKNILPSKELAEAFLAMMQLMSLRQTWICGLESDWSDGNTKKWCIIFQNCKLHVDYFLYNAIPLSFPTKEMAEDFMKCFKDLLEIAKPLI